MPLGFEAGNEQTTLWVRAVRNLHSFGTSFWEPAFWNLFSSITIKQTPEESPASGFYAAAARQLRVDPAASFAWRRGANAPGKREPAVTQQDKSDLEAME
jgi:hypothetical protein